MPRLLLALVAAALALAGPHVRADDLPRRPYLGARLVEAPGGEHATVVGVTPGGPAADAGLAPGDRIVAIAGGPIDVHAAVYADRLLHGRAVGAPVTLGVLRGGGVVELELTPQRWPDDGRVRSYVELSDGARVRTFLTLPGGDPGVTHAAVLLVQDRGLWTADLGVTRTAAWDALGEALAEAGYVTMRVDPPGVGDSEGPPAAELDFGTQLEAFGAAFTALASHPRVDPERVAIVSTGEGAAIAALLARDAPVAGVMANSAFVRSWHETILHDLRAGWSRGMGDEQLEGAMRLMHGALAPLLAGSDADTLAADRPGLAPAIDYLTGGRPGMLLGRGVEYSRQLDAINLASVWRLVDAPVLLTHGQWDPAAIPDDLERIAELVNLNDRGDAWVFEIPAADGRLATQDHEWMAMTKAAGTELSPVAVSVVTAWLDSVTRPTTSGMVTGTR
jgi:hypothetical protein